jgi:predicted Na+-dependent transporter
VALAGQGVEFSPNAVLLAFLLFNPGLGVRLDRARDVLRRPLLLGTGLVVNMVLPVAVTAALALGLAWWGVACRVGADYSQQTALMFGLGMTNHGIGLVLAATALAGHPQVMLPILFYNLVQHVAAGVVNAARKRSG